MRYPVNNYKTEWNGIAGYKFGDKTPYGYHEGIDINDNCTGNSDLGKEIFAISNGELVYWHGAKHPTTGFGYHSVYKIEGEWGKRWVHQSHCMPDITQAPKAVTENERIARVGNSGTTYAHIHFAIFKVDPATLRDGIDTIARNQQELNDWWENPIDFIEKWSNCNANIEPMAVITQKELDKIRKERDNHWNALKDLSKKLEEQKMKNKSLDCENLSLSINLEKYKRFIKQMADGAYKFIEH